MIATRFSGIADAKARVGQEIGVSDWMLIDQQRVNAFAQVTGDQQWIHVDVERAKRESPYGGPIAHGSPSRGSNSPSTMASIACASPRR